MKIFNRVLRGLFWVLILALLLLPLVLLYRISNQEMQFYARPTIPVMEESATGRISQVTRMDLQEYVLVSGQFVPEESLYIPLEVKRPDLIRWEVQVGDEIQEGQLLGTCQGKELRAECDGVVQEIKSYSSEDAYIKVQLISPLVLECKVDRATMNLLKLPYDMTMGDGAAVKLTYAAQIMNPDGTYTVRLSVDSEEYIYGQSLKDCTIFTGRTYPQVLVVDKDCVYQKTTGEDAPWYVRMVSAEGAVIGETEVKIGYASGSVVSITGVPEGSYCDAGYRLIVQGNES